MPYKYTSLKLVSKYPYPYLYKGYAQRVEHQGFFFNHANASRFYILFLVWLLMLNLGFHAECSFDSFFVGDLNVIFLPDL